MGRIRTIKPEFFINEALSSLPEATHLLAAGLLTYADDDGYFNAHPGLVKAALSPLRESSVSIHDALQQLREIGFIDIGKGDDGRTYGRIVHFTDHQRVNRPTPSKIKALEIGWENSVITHGVLSEMSLPEGKGRERKGREQGKEIRTKPKNRVSYSEDFENLFWKAYPDTAGMSKQLASQEWERLDTADQKKAVEALPKFGAWVTKQGKDYRIVHACRYLSQRRFDGFAELNGNGQSITEDDSAWAKRLTGARNIKKWCFQDWGPPPNSPGCRVPKHLVTETDGQGWVDVEVRPAS